MKKVDYCSKGSFFDLNEKAAGYQKKLIYLRIDKTFFILISLARKPAVESIQYYRS